MGYVEPAKTEVFFPPTLPPNMNFDITSAMIYILILKGVFSGVATDDSNMNLTNFTGICTLYTIPWVDQVELRLLFFY